MSDLNSDRDQLQKSAIDGLIQRERNARDAGRWDEMADCYHPDSRVEVSWFQGTGKEFAARSSAIAGGKVYTFHSMSPAVVTLRRDRALADTGCSIHGLTEVDGVDIDIVSHTHLLWRMLRTEAGWLIAGMRAYYISDSLIPLDPGRVPLIDQGVFRSLRRSYRSIGYSMKRAGFDVRDDLPGVDRPETVQALQAQEQQWLAQA